MKVLAIIQARLSSQRLPNKILLQIPPESGVSMLELVVRKVRLALKVDEICVVTPDEELSKLLDYLCVDYYIKGWEGRDVLREFYESAGYEETHPKDIIVRITADCPLIRPSIINECIEKFIESDVEFLYNTDESTGQLAGEGSDVEVFSYEVLERAYREAKKLEEREHVTLWMRRNCKKLFYPSNELDILSVNTYEDYEKANAIIQDKRDRCAFNVSVRKYPPI